MTSPDLARLELKVDRLTDAINQLVLIEERQATQAKTIEDLAGRLLSVERKVDMWVNRGIGVWAVVASAFAVFKYLH